MDFLPFDRMWDRLKTSRQDSDVTLAYDLLLFGELVTKITALGLVAALEDSRQRHHYRLRHMLVRSDGIGDWSTVIDDVLTGPASGSLVSKIAIPSSPHPLPPLPQCGRGEVERSETG
jgi:hypothetical protein